MLLRTTGTPASINVISDQRGETGSLLQPYPNWSWYENGTQCNKRIINICKIAVGIF